MSYLEKNINALRQVNPELAKIIEDAGKDDWVELLPGNKPGLVLTHGIKRHTVYENKDPDIDAKETIKNVEFHPDEATIMLGLGLGYALNQAIKKAKKGHLFVIVEPSKDIIKKAFELFDFSEATLQNKLYIALSQSDVSVIISMLDGQTVISNWQMIMSKYCHFKQSIYAEIIDHTMNLINQLYCNTGTVMGAGAKIALNDIENFPYTIGEPGVNLLFNKFKGKTAVMVSTGPSLQKNIHLLMDKKVQDSVIIIAVAQALRILLAYDIKPDLVCTVDYGEVNLTHFDGLMDCDVPLVALNRTYAPILKQWKGKKFIVGTPVPGYDESSSALIAKKGSVDQGGSVSHLCMGLAIAMGCKNVIIIGQDLAYDTDRSHNPNADSGGHIEVENGQIWWVVNDQRSHLSGQNKKYTMGAAHYVEGYFGAPVLTNLGLASFITAFENIIMRNPDVNFINATEGGAHIKGATRMTLGKALKKYSNLFLNKNIIDKAFNSYDGSGEFVKSIDVLKNELDLYDEIIDNANKALNINKKLKKARDKKDVDKLLIDNEKFTTTAELASRKSPLITVAIFAESRRIQSRELNEKRGKAQLFKNKDYLKKRIERNELILKAAIREAEKLKASTVIVYDLMKEVVETNNVDLLKDNTPYTPDVSDAKTYFKNGNFARPLLDARKADNTKVIGHALVMRQESIDKGIKYQKSADHDTDIEYLSCISEAIKLGKEANKNNTGDYSEAFKLLNKAIKLKPDDLMAKWGLATTYHYMKDNKKSVQLYGELVEKFPDNINIKFEYATVMINTDIPSALKVFEEIFKQTEEYDWYFNRISELYDIIGEKELAISFLKQYLVKHENDYESWKKLSILCDKYGEKEEATKAYNKYISIIGK